jgi:hypothetical protein
MEGIAAYQAFKETRASNYLMMLLLCIAPDKRFDQLVSQRFARIAALEDKA